MSTDQELKPETAATKTVAVKLFGIGNAGVNIAGQLIQADLRGVRIAAVNTDEQSVATSSAPGKIVLESRLLRGLGTGGDPERGRAAANEHLSMLKEACAGAEVVFLVCGLGGGAGTGISPVLARAAKDTGALVLVFVTLPFDCEGNRRRQQALHGLNELKAIADGVVCLPNQKLFRLIDENTSVLNTFQLSNQLLCDGISHVWRLLVQKGLIEIHLADLCALLRDHRGESVFATAEACGATRSREVVDKLFAHPMLDGGQMLTEADAVLVSLIGGSDLAMAEVNRVMEHVNGKCSKAQVIMGAAIDDHFRDRLAVTIVATRRSESSAAAAELDEVAPIEAREPAEAFDSQLLDRAGPLRPQSRFVPPPPALAPDKVEQLARRGTGIARSRKAGAKMRQGTLPLEIVTKGRFDKSEPTIHKGEDLDVPTYIRRGVSLN